MKRALIVLLALVLIPLPATLTAQEGATEWAPWFDEELTARVPVDIGLGSHYPSGWEGPRLVTHELDVTSALVEAGWPTDGATGLPQRFTLDEDSVRVVEDAESEPLPALTWPGSLLSGPGAFPTGHQIVTVAFLAPEDVDDVHIYFDRKEDGLTDPLPRDPVAEQRIMQLLSGPGAGHTLMGFVEDDVNLLVTSATSTEVVAERRKGQNWNTLGCTGAITAAASQWRSCTVSGFPEVTAFRVTADQPVVAYTWDPEAEETPFIPLPSASGFQEGTRFHAPHVTKGDPTRVKLAGISASCQATVGSAAVDVPVGTPITEEIREHTVIEAECPILAWIPGRGPAPVPTAIGDTFSTAALSSDGSQRLLATGDQGSLATLVNFNDDSERASFLGKGKSARTDQPLRGTSWTVSGADEPFTLQTEGNTLWPAIWGSGGSLPLAPTPDTSVGWLGPLANANQGGQLRLAAITLDGTTPFNMALDGQRLSTDQGLSEVVTSQSGSGSSPPAGLAEVWLKGEPQIFFASALVDEGPHGPSLVAGHLSPVDTTQGPAEAIGPLFNLALDPETRIGAPGEVETFTLLGSGAIRNPDGSLDPLELQLNVEATTDTLEAPPLEPDFQEGSTVTLPVEEPGELNTVVVTIASTMPPGLKPSYNIEVSGTPVDGGDAIPTQATLTVIPQREITLTFEDGSSLQDFPTEDGEVTAPLILRNEGTDTEPVALSTTLPDTAGWTAELLDARTEQPIDTVELAPDAQRDLLLHITAGTEGPLILNAKASARSLLDASVGSDVTARIAHGVSIDMSADVTPDLVSLHRNDRATVNLTLDNEGSPVNVQVQPDELEGLVAEAAETSLNLGEPGTGTSQARVPLNLTVGPQAPLGGVLVLTIELQIQLGELDPVTQLLSVRVQVTPQHNLDPGASISLLPGVRQEVELPVRATGDTDEDVRLELLEVPAGWIVERPERFQVPLNTTAPLRMNITPKAQEEPGSYTLRLLASPIDGSEPLELSTRAAVEEGPAYKLTAPQGMNMAVGEERNLTATVTNVGNAAGDATLEVLTNNTEASVTPPSHTLVAGESGTFTLGFQATAAGGEQIELRTRPGGQASIGLEVGRAELRLELVSSDPATPSVGERFQAVVSATNDGDAAARDVDIALMSGEETLAKETIGFLAPGNTATLSLVIQELPTLEDLRLVIDPDDRYSQETTSDDAISLSQQGTPLPALGLLLIVGSLAALAVRRTRT